MSNEYILEFLNRRHDDRGVMAALRAGLSETTQYRATPFLGWLGAYNSSNGWHRGDVIRYVCAWFAMNPQPLELEDLRTSTDNIGTMCFRLLDKDEKEKIQDRGDPGPLTKRFLHLLQAEGDEIFDRITPFIRKAHSKGVDVNYFTLLNDLCQWRKDKPNDRIKQRWASGFWNTRVLENSKDNSQADTPGDTADIVEVM